jgi:hypothetical protein
MENNMKFSRLKIVTASIVLFFGCQTNLIAADNTSGQKADQQPAAQSTAKAPPVATTPPQAAWRGYYPHRPYHRPYRRRGSGSGFGFGSGSGPSFGSSRGPGWDDWGRDPFYDYPFMNDPFMDHPYYGRDPWRRNDSGSGFGFGSGSGPSWGSGSDPGWGSRSGPRFYDRGRGPRDWDSGGMGFGW